MDPNESKASSLLASLTAGEEGDEDLFGPVNIPGPLPSATSSAAGSAAAVKPPSSAVAVETAATNGTDAASSVPVSGPSNMTGSALLAGSGLLFAGESPSGGLFDAVDEEERRQQEEEQRRKEEQAAAAAAAAEQEKLKQQEAAAAESAQRQQQMLAQHQHQQRQILAQQQQQQQPQQYSVMHSHMQSHMQDLSLSTSNFIPQQQQQQPLVSSQSMMTSQQQQGMMSPQQNMMQQQPPMQNQPYFQQQQQPPLPNVTSPSAGGVTYREHPEPVQAGYGGQSYYYSTTGGQTTPNMMRGRYQAQNPTEQTQTSQQPSLLAGLHNPGQPKDQGAGWILPPPTPTEPLYGKITVSEPILINSGVLAPPHWSYQVQTIPRNGGGGSWVVRRRFRHVVALEERIRLDCPGAILPPRPEKHATRPIEEATTTQSPQFALQRASELETYLNNLVEHPIVGKSTVLKLFLSLQDDMGTAWPEVSSNAITRMGAVGAGAAVMLAEGTMHLNGGEDIGEDSAELLALASSEGLRMGAVTQAVPKMEGAITLLRELGERSGDVGMELNKMGKEVETTGDPELSAAFEILSSGLLRDGRRTKRLSVELSAAMNSFVLQYKLCRYERMAFADRRAALKKRHATRGKADVRAQKLALQQRSLQAAGKIGALEKMEYEASVSDEMAVEALRECQLIGGTLQSEVRRVEHLRRAEWSKSMKVLASCMKEAAAERAAIWQSSQDAFLAAFPNYQSSAPDASVVGGQTEHVNGPES